MERRYDYNNMILDGTVTELHGQGVFIMESTTPHQDGPDNFISLRTPVRSDPEMWIHESLQVGTRVRVTGLLTKTGILANTISFLRRERT